MIHPKWSYPSQPQTIIRYGSPQSFPDLQSSNARIAEFRQYLTSFLEQHEITTYQAEESMRNTGGQMDIDYYALVLAGQNGGCECVFYTINWGGEYEAMRPRIQLYGSWQIFKDPLSIALEAQYGVG